jgi:predicted dehydrogenase
MRMVTLAVIGAGLRGAGYARLAREAGFAEVVAVAEPDQDRRAAFAAEHGIPAERAFADWRDLLAGGRLADAVIVATQDRMHLQPAVRAAELGYHILLEKPMAPTEEATVRMAVMFVE